MSKRKKIGLCKLTGLEGRFVDSHLLPKALTRADGLADGLVQLGDGKIERRWSSWYDNELVTEQGERILADYDNWAISTLRKYRLVWSGWGPIQSLSDVDYFIETGVGVRVVKFVNVEESRRLRLFFLSLLWRAAATKRREFSEVKLSPSQLEDLRAMVATGNPEPMSLYPISLSQLTTMGPGQNMAPIKSSVTVPQIGGVAAFEKPIFRFFLDGLIAHFSCLAEEENTNLDVGDLILGAEPTLTVSAIKYEASAQMLNLQIVKGEATLGRPLFEINEGVFR